MSFKVGDKVRFLNADGYGTIISILDLSRAEVKNEHGFEEVLYLKELVLEGAQEDYQTDGLLFNDEIKNKLRTDKNTDSGTDLNKKLNQLNKFTPNQRLIIDLHIEKLIDSHSGMSNF